MRSWNLLEIEAPDGVRTPTVLHSADGRAIMVRVAPGQELGDHEVRERAWLTVVEGEVELRAGAETVTATPGTLLMFEPGERHSVTSASGARLLLILAPWPGEGHYGPERAGATSV